MNREKSILLLRNRRQRSNETPSYRKGRDLSRMPLIPVQKNDQLGIQAQKQSPPLLEQLKKRKPSHKRHNSESYRPLLKKAPHSPSSSSVTSYECVVMLSPMESPKSKVFRSMRLKPRRWAADYPGASSPYHINFVAANELMENPLRDSHVPYFIDIRTGNARDELHHHLQQNHSEMDFDEISEVSLDECLQQLGGDSHDTFLQHPHNDPVDNEEEDEIAFEPRTDTGIWLETFPEEMFFRTPASPTSSFSRSTPTEDASPSLPDHPMIVYNIDEWGVLSTTPVVGGDAEWASLEGVEVEGHWPSERVNVTKR